MQEVYTDLEDNKTEIHKAIDVFKKTLKKDPEYYITWQANIAMAFVDQCTQDTEEFTGDRYIWLHENANQAVKNFLNLLITTK